MTEEPNLFSSRKTLRQFFTYAVIGALTNVLGYTLYIILTNLLDSPKLTVTLLYLLGASIGFYANRHLTFRHNEGIGVTGVRYLLAQVAGYLLNLVLLLLFVDWLNFPHQIVQAMAIVVVAIFLFVVLRLFVFAPSLVVTGVVR